MLKVYICEDIQAHLDQLLEMTKDIIAIKNLDMVIEMISKDPEEILENVKKVQGTGLYLLDVNLKTDMTGFMLAKEIRKYDPTGYIVFITTHSEMTLLTFKYGVEAMDYIIKDDIKNLKKIKENIQNCILNAYEKYSNTFHKQNKVFNLKIDEDVINVEYDQILFFETSDTVHKIRLHLFNRILEFYAKMKDIEDQLIEDNLNKTFYRCHNSYIVNIENIYRIDINQKIAIMKNDSECFISRRMLKPLLKAFENINEK